MLALPALHGLRDLSDDSLLDDSVLMGRRARALVQHGRQGAVQGVSDLRQTVLRALHSSCQLGDALLAELLLLLSIPLGRLDQVQKLGHLDNGVTCLFRECPDPVQNHATSSALCY
eukprot:scaffold422749_cov53-Prasinocladus_malaysianus.AAC.1